MADWAGILGWYVAVPLVPLFPLRSYHSVRDRDADWPNADSLSVSLRSQQ